MADEVYCDICKEQNTRTPATIAFRIQREHDPDATPQYVRCCERYEGQAAGAAAFMRRHLAPATVYRVSLSGGAGWHPALSLASVIAIGKEPQMENLSRRPALNAQVLKAAMHRAFACLFVLFVAFASGTTSSIQAAESESKKLYLADFGNDRIWVMDLNTRQILTSYPAPTRASGLDAMPIGSAWFRGRLYVNNQTAPVICGDDDIFALDPQSGAVLGRARTPGCLPIDGMAAIPEAGLLAGIEGEGFGVPERLHLLRPVFENGQLSLISVGVIDVNVPSDVVRGLAYLNGKIYITEESTGAIYIFRLDLSTMTVAEEGSISIGTAAPGLATLDENHLIAYDIFNHKLLIVEAQPNGQIIDVISLENTGIGVVAALETERLPPVSNVNDRVTFELDPSTYSFTPDTIGCPEGFAGKFNFDARLLNVSNQVLASLEISVAELTGGNVLLTENGLIGVDQLFGVPLRDGFTDGRLSPEEFVDVPFTVCLNERQQFTLFVDVAGTVNSGTNAIVRRTLDRLH